MPPVPYRWTLRLVGFIVSAHDYLHTASATNREARMAWHERDTSAARRGGGWGMWDAPQVQQQRTLCYRFLARIGKQVLVPGSSPEGGGICRTPGPVG